ncbi:MAG: 3-deoxy-D-manno-octulosonic acid transferase [Planctomycetota bacterium]
MRLNLLYLLALGLACPWLIYRRSVHGRYRRGLREKLIGLPSNHPVAHGKDCIWVHAVSVGEVNLVRPLIARLREVRPQSRVVLSVGTDAGYDLALKHHGADEVFFCPLDFSWAVERTIKRLRPTELILAELELWPNLIKSAYRHGVRVRVINARLSDRSSKGYRRFSWLTRPTFLRLAQVLCQDETTAERFFQCGTPKDRLSVTGSLKFDNAPATRECVEVESRAHWAGVNPWHRVWIVGSTQYGEERVALDCYGELTALYPELRLVLVPRHPERFDEVASLIQDSGFKLRRRSTDAEDAESWSSEEIILVDTIGELRAWWGVGQIAFVGGSFGDRGGQNMLEPAGYGSAVSFGPNTKNFSEIARRLLEADGAIRVQSPAELHSFVKRCLDHPPAADELGRNAKRLVNKHRGAMERTLNRLLLEGETVETHYARAS